MSGDFAQGEVFVDVTRLFRRLRQGRLPTGVDRVCLAYVRHCRSRARPLLVEHGVGVTFSDPVSDRLFNWLLHPHTHSSMYRTLQVLLRIPFRRVPNDSWVLNMGHSGLDQPRYLAWLIRKRIQLLVMAHDLIPLTHPEYCRADSTAAHERRLQTILHHARGIVSNSQVTAEELERYAKAREFPLPPLCVIPLGVENPQPAPEIACDLPLQAPYFLLLGTIEPRKNHAFILYLWERMLREVSRGRVPHLLIIGQRGWMCDSVIHRLIHDDRIRERVTWLPHCSDEELVRYLQHAQALLFPSAVEGYGLPLLEALQQETPVLASPLPAFREIAGDIPEYLALEDEDQWLQAILDYSNTQHPRRREQLTRLTGFTVPTWEAHFAAFRDFAMNL